MTPEQIIRAVVDEYNITEADLRSPRRAAVPAKKAATRRLRGLKLSWSAIARLMNCHHTTAMYRGKKP